MAGMAFGTMGYMDRYFGKVSLKGNHVLYETKQIPLSEQLQWKLLFHYSIPNTTIYLYIHSTL